MCRMIAAVGRLDMPALVDALRAMASNANDGYDHEFRGEGSDFSHDCGWGVVFRDHGRLVRKRSATSCLGDPEFDALSGVSTDLAVLHARRTPDRSTIDVCNSHPFIETWRGEVWAFCHNGAVNDLGQLTIDDSLVSSGGVDSELLFRHLLSALDTGRVDDSVAEILGAVHDFSCLNCFLATSGRVIAHARLSPGTPRPRYYTMWRGRGDGFSLVSSEPLEAVGATWSAMADGTALVLRP